MTNRDLKGTILLAEDEEAIRTLLQAILEPEGYKLLVAEDGQAAWDLSRTYRGKIDLILTDIVMPRMTGVELAEKVTRERPNIKVLLLSGYDLQIRVPRTDWQFFSKPYLPQQLLKKIEDMLGKKVGRAGGKKF